MYVCACACVSVYEFVRMKRNRSRSSQLIRKQMKSLSQNKQMIVGQKSLLQIDR